MRVVVVGAGIAGLAAAHALRDRAEVVVVEAADRVGGKLRTGELAGRPVEAGAESFLARRPEARELAEAVGLGAELVAPGTLAASVWSRGALRPLPARTVFGVPGDLGALARSGVLPPAGLARAALEPFLPPTRPGDDVEVGRYLAGRFGRPLVDRLVDPLLGGVYAGRADELSLAATLPELARLARRHGRLLRPVRGTLPRIPRPGPVFLTVRGGLGRFAEAVAAASGAILRLDTAARELAAGPDGGWRLTVGPTTAPETLDADAVILAVPAAPARRLLSGVAPSAAAELAGIDYASLALVAIATRATPLPAGSGFLVPAIAGRLVKAVTFFTAKWPHLVDPRAGDAVTIVRASIGRYGDSAVLHRDDAELTRAAVAELAELAGLTAPPIATRVTRWGGGLPQYAVGHLDRVARIRAAVSRRPGLAVCGAAYDGVGIPACIGSGQRAAAVVLGEAAPAGDPIR